MAHPRRRGHTDLSAGLARVRLRNRSESTVTVDLRRTFPDTTGFSPRNLKYLRAFAAAWPDWEVVQRRAAQLPWRHHQYLLDKLDDTTVREWYAIRSIEEGWSRDVLAFCSATSRPTGPSATTYAQS